MNTTLVTGANGFVGRELCAELIRRHYTVRAMLRGDSLNRYLTYQCIQIPDIGFATNWTAALLDVESVVHLAARVHIMHDTTNDPLAAFRAVNVEGTLNLARQAAAAGVKRFVFISSVKVNGESTTPGQAFSETDVPVPQNAYGQSKHEAEQSLRRLAADTGMEVVIIRPPLVYGPGVKANFLDMMRWLAKKIPLPLGDIHNKRSFVALDNLVDLIATCIDHTAAANQTFLVSDGEDISTTQLLRRMGGALGKPARLLPVPVWMLEAGAVLLGKRDLLQRLCGNLQVDISKAKDLLGWTPPVGMDEGLRATAAHYLAGLAKGK